MQSRDVGGKWLSWAGLSGLVFSCGLGPRVHLIPENKRAFDAGDDDVGSAVAVHILDDELRANAGPVVNQLRNEFRAAFGFWIANRPVPVKDGRAVGVGIDVALQVRI